jgi:hypothetical protein
MMSRFGLDIAMHSLILCISLPNDSSGLNRALQGCVGDMSLSQAYPVGDIS